MNIIKFKDIILNADNAPQLTEQQRELFNTKFKGKYVYAVDWTYCVPLEDMSQQEYIDLSKHLVNTDFIVALFVIDGAVVERVDVAVGDTPIYSGPTPTKESWVDNNHKRHQYTFTGWSPEIAPIIEDTVYIAQFEETIVDIVSTITIIDQKNDTVTTSTAQYGQPYSEFGQVVNPIPTYEGFTFGGCAFSESYQSEWPVNQNGWLEWGTSLINSEGQWICDDDQVTLYVVWLENN